MMPLAAAVLVVMAATAAWADFDAGLAAFKREDYATALAEWRPLAEAGMVEAQFNLGLLHLRGKGTASDPAEAHRWFLAAAKAGYARAQYRVAEMFEKGEGVKQNLVQAHLWFAEAGAQKHEDARKRRRRVAKQMTPHEIAEAEMLARHRRRAAKAGD